MNDTNVVIKVAVKAKNESTGDYTERGMKLNVIGELKDAMKFVEAMQLSVEQHNGNKRPQLGLKKDI